MCTPSFMQAAFPPRRTTFQRAGGGVALEARKPMSRARSPIDDLRLAIDCLPVRTRRAMLDGIRSSEIIVGAYSDRAGGVCPMLAAHRCGGRTSFVSFAHAWDRFANARRARRATPRELRILDGQLEASLLAEERFDLGAAIADHEALRARSPEERAGRTRETRRDRWAWLHPRRSPVNSGGGAVAVVGETRWASAEEERALRRIEAELETLRAGGREPSAEPAEPVG
jgi:hypothetical protein